MPKPRQVKSVERDADGDITALKGNFGRVPIKKAIQQLKAGSASYAIGQSDLSVVAGATREYLRSEADGKKSNNLENLSG